MIGVLLMFVVCLTPPDSSTWPTYGGDAARSHVSDVPPPTNPVQAWSRDVGSSPAWPGPARRDAYNKVEDLQSRLRFDDAPQPSIVDGVVIVGSSRNDTVEAVDIETGVAKWTYWTEGPVRFAPVIHGNLVLVGSDDGHLYALDRHTGKERWRQRPGPLDRRVAGNGRIVSAWPIRTGPVVIDGSVYTTAGIFPPEGVWVAAYDAQSGEPQWSVRHTDLPAQGYLVGSPDRLYVPASRDKPVILNRADGTRIGQLDGQGGTWVLLTGDGVVYGPGKQGQMSDHEPDGDSLATFQGLRMVVADGRSYLLDADSLSALDRTRYRALAVRRRDLRVERKSLDSAIKAGDVPANTRAEAIATELDAIAADMRACMLWRVEARHPHALLLAGGVLIAGGDHEIAAFAMADGALMWTRPVDGAAKGLAVVDGALLVSTDAGRVHCFREGGELE
jgi:outer membrane protein assembly factor BamB